MATFLITGENLLAVAHAVHGAAPKPEITEPVAAAMTKLLPEAGISAFLPLCHFVGQSAHESFYFHTLKEMGDATYFARYNNRHDLGNGPHDGPLFYGRGIFQCTGRANYHEYGKKLGIDLIAHPELAADPEVSVKIAILFWNDRHLSQFANNDDCFHVSAKINGINRKTGEPNGLDSRKTLTASAKKVFAFLKAA